MRYLVTGLESSSTKIVSKMIAYNLNIIENVDDWSGHDEVSDEENIVYHRSIPHGPENYLIDENFIKDFDYIILCTRDWNCSLLSKIENHQHNPILAYQESQESIDVIKRIMLNREINIFSLETAFLLQDFYTLPFLKSLGIADPKHVTFENPNRKYIKDIGL